MKKTKPFRVPDGYFDTLPTRVMERINATPVKPKPLWWPRIAAAAAMVGIFFLAGAMLYQSSPTPVPTIADATHSDTDSTNMGYTDEHLDYAMLNNSDIEYYLTSAE